MAQTAKEQCILALSSQIETAFVEQMELLGAGDASKDAMKRLLTTTIQEMHACQLRLGDTSRRMLEENPIVHLKELPANAVVGCPGVLGAFTHEACEKLLDAPQVRFYEHFGQVAKAVARGEVDFGVLPVENSSAGQVNQALELTAQYRFYICADTRLKVEQCLCIHPDSDPDAIDVVISHPQGLMQCAHYLQEKGLPGKEYSNTATAAKKVSELGAGTTACICSRRCAQLYGLRILADNVQDSQQNYTRFVCISNRNLLLEGADTVALTLSFPNAPGRLNQLLTRFAVCDLDLCRIQSMPLGNQDFSVRFHLDFKGSILDQRVTGLLSALYGELEQFTFLGNFLTVE